MNLIHFLIITCSPSKWGHIKQTAHYSFAAAESSSSDLDARSPVPITWSGCIYLPLLTYVGTHTKLQIFTAVHYHIEESHIFTFLTSLANILIYFHEALYICLHIFESIERHYILACSCLSRHHVMQPRTTFYTGHHDNGWPSETMLHWSSTFATPSNTQTRTHTHTYECSIASTSSVCIFPIIYCNEV